MKKMAVMALCVAAAISLAACGQSSSSTTKTASSSASKAETGSTAESESKTEDESKAESLLTGGQTASESSAEELLDAEISVSESVSDDSAPLLGGWTAPDSVVVTDEMKAKLEKATETMIGATYVPVAYLGSQVVSGTNHRLLCLTAPVIPDAQETYAIVTLYESLDGEVSITEVVDSGRTSDIFVPETESDAPITGGWSAPETPEVTEEAKAALEKALEGMAGAEYKPVALLATQIVAGTNYCLLCEVTPVTPNAQSQYSLVYVYADLEGNAEITETADFTSEEVNEANENEVEMMQIANPIVDHETMEEASAAAGFDMTAPETVEGYSEKYIQTIDNDLIQVIFLSGEDRLFIRKGTGSDDISGDYNFYDQEKTVEVGGRDVLMKGSEDKISTAIWTEGDYAFAISSDLPLDEETVTALIGQVA